MGNLEEYSKKIEIFCKNNQYKEAIQYALKTKTIYAGKHNYLGVIYYDLGAIYKEIGDFSLALEYTSEAKKIFESIYESRHPNIANIYINLGAIYRSLGNFPSALEYTLKAKEICENIYKPGHTYISVCYINLGDIYQKLKNLPLALEYTLKAKEIFENIDKGNHLRIRIAIYKNLSEIYLILDDLPLTLKYALKAKDIQEEFYDDKDSELAISYSDIGEIYRILENFSLSLEYNLKAKEIFEIIHEGNHFKLATTNNSLGRVYASIGDLHLALKYTLKAKEIFENINKGNHSGMAACYANLGGTYLKLGNSSLAHEYTLKAKEIFENINEANDSNIVACYINLSAIYQDSGDLVLAIEYALQAKRIFENIYEMNHSSLATIYNNLAALYKGSGDLHLSLEYASKAKDIFEVLYEKNHSSLGTIYANLGNLCQTLRYYPKALQYNLRSKEIREAIYKSTHYDLAYAYINLALTYGSLRTPKESYHYMGKAYDIYIHNRKINFSYISTKQKLAHNKNNKVFINNFINISYYYFNKLAEENNVDKQIQVIETAFNNWLQFKGSISDFENIITILYNQIEDKEIKELIEKREELRKRLSALYHTKEEDEKKLEIQRKIIEEIDEEIREIENTLSKASSILSDELSLEKITYKDLAPALKEDDLYIDYAYIDSSYYIFTLNYKEEINFFLIDEETSNSIGKNVEEYREHIKEVTNNKNAIPDDRKISKDILYKLYQLLIQDYSFFEEKKRYILSLDGPLAYIPFEALYDGQKYLIERKSISYVPSGKEFARLIRNKSNDSEDIVVFANPNFDEEITIQTPKDKNGEGTIRSLSELCELGEEPFPQLPGTEDELEAIDDALYPEKVISFSKEKATKELFIQTTNTKILHCATHAFFLDCPNTDNPLLKIGIAFSGANVLLKDGSRPHVATGLELVSMKLKGTDLVVLSACDSATGDSKNSEGIMGLNKAFIQAGAKSVVASLWKANDQQTALFFEHAYKLIYKEIDEENETINYHEIIRSSKIKFIRDNKHSILWAGFTFSGV